MKNITTTFITRTRLLAFLTITCFALGFTGAQAGDNQGLDRGSSPNTDKFLLISFDENFTSETTIDGTTTLAGAFSDAGARHQDFTTTVHGNEVIVTGTINITGSLGTLNTQFTGAIPNNGSNPNLIEGVESITSGTGIYAGARGKGTFEATVDFVTFNIVGVAELKVQMPH
jgi:hypothetical protein